jgi:hypothetical protein
MGDSLRFVGKAIKQGTICTPLAKRLNAAFLFCAIFQKNSEKGIKNEKKAYIYTA